MNTADLKQIAENMIFMIFAMACAPLIPGIVNRVKAFFAGRKGPPLLQPYYDIFKLMNKGSVYSRTTSWIFKVAPMISLSAVFCALILVPCPGGGRAPISFYGDIIFFAYLLSLARFLTVLAALDTGSSFEGMGASREVWFSALAEPAFFAALAACVSLTGAFSFGDIFSGMSGIMNGNLPVIILVLLSIFIVLLVENCRVPADDPNTHLELTMIHEVMVLDYSGPDLGIILYASYLKLFLFCSIIAGLVLPSFAGNSLSAYVSSFCVIVILSVVVGTVESIMARFRFAKVSRMLIAAFALSMLAIILTFR